MLLNVFAGVAGELKRQEKERKMPLDENFEPHIDRTSDAITEANARNLPSTVLNLKVVDGRSYELMANGVLLLRKAKKFFEDRARPRIDEAHKHWKNLLADLKTDVDPIEAAQRYGDRQLSDYDAEQQRLASLEQLRLQAEQMKRDEDEKMQLAELAEKAGEKALAAEILDAPSTEPVVVVQKDVPKVAGLSFREDWKFEIVDALAIPREYQMPDEAKIGKIVRALKQTCYIPGIRIFAVKVPIGRG